MDKSDLSDERLVILHQQKRMNAFFIIYGRYKNYGCAIVHNILLKTPYYNALKDEKDAIFYDGVTEAIERYDQSRGGFRQFLASIIDHETRNCIRNFRKDPLADYVSLDAKINEDGDLYFADSLTFADHNPLPQEILNTGEKKKSVEKVYRGVYKRKTQKIIMMKRQGYRVSEIAKKLNMTNKAVYAVIYRIKHLVRVKKNGKVKK
ncbi:MAG: hypothetical protein MJ213_06020 [Bacilli bacterium]|nr:hypothetical protein [Bacilli bacterium]